VKGEASLIKYDLSRDHDAVGGEIKVAIPFMIWGIADEDTPCGTGSKLMWGYRGKGWGSKHTQRPEGACR
jgi:hypothetical protein